MIAPPTYTPFPPAAPFLRLPTSSYFSFSALSLSPLFTPILQSASKAEAKPTPTSSQGGSTSTSNAPGRACDRSQRSFAIPMIATRNAAACASSLDRSERSSDSKSSQAHVLPGDSRPWGRVTSALCPFAPCSPAPGATSGVPAPAPGCGCGCGLVAPFGPAYRMAPAGQISGAPGLLVCPEPGGAFAPPCDAPSPAAPAVEGVPGGVDLPDGSRCDECCDRAEEWDTLGAVGGAEPGAGARPVRRKRARLATSPRRSAARAGPSQASSFCSVRVPFAMLKASPTDHPTQLPWSTQSGRSCERAKRSNAKRRAVGWPGNAEVKADV